MIAEDDDVKELIEYASKKGYKYVEGRFLNKQGDVKEEKLTFIGYRYCQQRYTKK